MTILCLASIVKCNSVMDDIFITTTYGIIYAKTLGDADRPVVLGIHGWSKRNGWHTWEPLMGPLAEAGYQVVCVDMPGWGESTTTVDGLLMGETAVLATLSILDGLGIDQAAAIMGKSWGAGLLSNWRLIILSVWANCSLLRPRFGISVCSPKLSSLSCWRGPKTTPSYPSKLLTNTCVVCIIANLLNIKPEATAPPRIMQMILH